MSASRNIIALLVACIAFVGTAAALKTIQAEERREAAANVLAPSRTFDGPLAVDNAFFDGKAPAAPAFVPIPTPPPDPVSASAYIVGDVATGQVYLKKNDMAILPFASMSKLITAIVSTDMYKPTDKITITPAEAQVPPELSGLVAGETFTASELLYPMLMSSSNIAAEALASSTDRGKFLDLMKGYSWEIGMPGSYFADPTGLSSRNAGTARGFFAMARYLYSKRPDILAITRTTSYLVATTTDHGSHDFVSIHPYVSYPGFIGGKTGHTDEALDTMLTIVSIGGHPIAVIVLHSVNQRARDTAILLDRVSALIAAQN